MTLCRAVLLCLVVTAFVDICSGLVLERLPRHIPHSVPPEPEEDDEPADKYDDSHVQKTSMIEEHHSEFAPYLLKPTWKAIYPLTQTDKRTRSHKKRSVHEAESEADQRELANILKDDDNEVSDQPDKKSVKKGTHLKTKRQTPPAEEFPEELKEEVAEEEPEQKEDFQEWLRREYYRNMAKSFASMRRKRNSGHIKPKSVPNPIKAVKKRAKKSVQSPTSLSEITDNLRNIEDQLFRDALQTMEDGGDEYDDDVRRQNRITNDLSLAYDLETMRNAFFRLRETLSNMENDVSSDGPEMYHTSRKRSKQCPALDQLTSDCSTLSDVMPEGTVKRLLLRACNWHEVCYTCGKAYGLTSESCDGSFIEQTQTICRNDAPCESTASLLVIPLRQRRVFYKRSNPEVCVEEPCVEAFLKEGLAAMEEGRYAMEDGIRHA